MDTTRLRYFLAIASTGHVGKAAELLHVSQPALSRAIRILEAEVGVELVRRQGRRLVLTAQGRELARRARPLLAELSEIPHDLAAERRVQRPLRYASHETFGTSFGAFVSERAGGLAFEHHYLGPEATTDALLARDVDIGITYLPVLHDDIEVTRVRRIPISTWGARSFAGTEFEDLPYAAPGRRVVGTAAGPQGLDAWPDETITRRVRYRVTHTTTALELCRSGLAVAFMADFLVSMFDRFTPEESRLVRLETPRRVSGHQQPVYVLTRREERPESYDAVADALRALQPD